MNAYQDFVRIFEAYVKRFDAMEPPAFQAEMKRIILEGLILEGNDKTRVTPLDELERFTCAGSIEAGAAMSVLCTYAEDGLRAAFQVRTANALTELVRRSEDMAAGAIDAALEIMAQDAIDEAIAAGKLEAVRDPKTGVVAYQKPRA